MLLTTLTHTAHTVLPRRAAVHHYSASTITAPPSSTHPPPPPRYHLPFPSPWCLRNTRFGLDCWSVCVFARARADLPAITQEQSRTGEPINQFVRREGEGAGGRAGWWRWWWRGALVCCWSVVVAVGV